MRAELLANLPSDKHDTKSAEALVALGFPTVEPILPEIVEWVKDGNWPVAGVLLPFLARIGAPVAPHLQCVLASSDDTWKYFVMQNIIGQSKELVTILRPTLERISVSPSPGEKEEELDAMATEILQR